MKNKVFESIKTNKNTIILVLILILGFTVRLIAIDSYPVGLNVDEASEGYDAYSLLNYGIDRNNNFLPIYMVAWGSGQSALYTYILIPFVKLLGLSVFSVRLPMALIGCVSLFIFYKMLKIMFNEKTALIGVLVLSICPWHIMKSRWGLDANIFPDIILLATFTLIYALKTNKKKLIYLAFLVAGISAYAYSTSYFFLPLFIIPLLIYLTIKKEINIKQAIISLGIVFVISLPIIIYVIINTFNLPQINLPFMTIPILTENRMEELSSVFSGNFLVNSFSNFYESFKIIFMQYDENNWNALEGSGIIYLVSWIFVIIGIYKSFKNRTVSNMIMNFWFIVSVLLMFIVEPNINRLNIIVFPLIFYVVIGIVTIIDKWKYFAIAIGLIYLVEFMSFVYNYINDDYSKYYTFVDDVEEVIEYVDELDVDTVYIEYSFKEPYIYVLFYTECDPNEYINTVEYFREDRTGFDNVSAFGKYKFYIPGEILEDENAVYVVSANTEINIDESNFQIVEFENYKVIEKIN